MDSTSDIRTKKNVKLFTDGLEVIRKLNPIKFQYNEKSVFSDLETEYVGLSAQEVEKIAPYMVSRVDAGENSGLRDKRALDVSALTEILINAVKEQQNIIEALEDRIERLEKK